MKARPASDPRSWRFQANIHGTDDPATSPLFNQCRHNTIHFLAWHRGYLYYFERILRQASGDASLCLPYWNWATLPVVPEPFRLPASPSNALYDDTRDMNDGSALDPTVNLDLANALDQTSFNDILGFSPLFEGSPHGRVHIAVNGNMSAFETAGRDPIFWLHHANIDRVWDEWLNRGGGRTNPSDAAFLNTQYSFADENGATVTRTVGELINSRQLGYRYDDVPNPVMIAQRAPARRSAVAAREERAVPLATSAAAEEEVAERTRLGLKPHTVKLAPVAQRRAALEAAAAPQSTGAAPARIALKVVNISMEAVPNFTYGVYLNLPEEDLSENRRRQHYVGSINFFGREHAEGHAHGDGPITFDEMLDATRVIRQLQRQRAWSADDLRVTLLPLTPIPPRGGEAKLEARTARSEERARVSYERVELLAQPD